MDVLKNVFAQNLIQLRTANHMTQYELGNKINYSDKAVSRWERGEAVPDAYVLLQLSALFHVSVDYLLHAHAENDLPDAAPDAVPLHRTDHRTITTITLIGVWTVGLLVFIILFLLGQTQWLVFVYTLPVSLVVHLVLNSIWGNAKLNLIIISALCWSLLGVVYLSFLEQNWWILFLLGAPMQLIVLLCFRIRKTHRRAAKSD